MHSSSLIPVLTLLFLAASTSSASVVVPGALTNSNADSLSPRHELLNHKRRHHAKMADLERRNLSPRALLSLTGFGTLYYDINGGGTCGPANGWTHFAETGGFTMCEPWTGPRTIAQRGSNRIVALPVTMMTGNLQKYCGKEVVAHYKGKTIGGLIAWDGCAACVNGNGIDFSSSIFGELVGESNCGAGKVFGVTWEITDNQIWDTNGNVVGGASNNGGNNGGDKKEDEWKPEPKPQPKPEPKPEWKPEPKPEPKSEWKPEQPKQQEEGPTSTWKQPEASPEPKPKQAEEWKPEAKPEQKWVEPSTSSTSKWVEPTPEPKKEEPKWEEPKKEEPKKEEEKPQWVQPEQPKKAEEESKPQSSPSANEPAFKAPVKQLKAHKSKGKCPARKKLSKKSLSYNTREE